MPAHKILFGDKWLYHQEFEARLVYHHEVDELVQQGWVDSPDKFQKTDTESTVTLSDLTRKELLSIALDKGISLGRNPRKQDIIEAINGFDNQ